MSRSARYAMDMEISRAAAALEPGSTAPTNQVNFDAIAALHPTPTPFHTPAGEDTPLQRAMAAPRIEIADKVVFKAAISMQKSTALWLQPYHLRVIAQIPLGAKRLARVCNLVINGEVPERIKPLIYDHKIFALDKASKHQADLEARVAAVAAAADSEAPVPKPKLRPIAIGCALLRLAEKSYATQMKEVFRRHLMPLQFGVAVPGGLNLWSTVVEAMLQDNPNSVFLGIDLTNCFNAMSRDHLIDECLQHAELRPLARYIAGTYPPGMLAWVRVEEAWAAVNFQSGCAHGRPLSASLAGILLGLALKAAKLAMATAAGLPLDSEAADRAFAAGAYIVDAGLIGEPAVVAAGFVAFKAAVEERGWKINLTKTVLGAAFYADIDPDAKTALDEELRVLLDPLDPERKIPIVWDGMVFLGTPSGAERNGPNTRPRADRHAPMPASGTYYRETTVEGFIDDHDIRLRRTVQLAQRDGRSCSELTALSKMFAIVILRFSCNSRDVHLIRRLPKRIVAEAAARHDRGIKFAWAAINGHAILPPETVTDDDGTIRRVYLHEQPQDSYPEHYDLSYDQVQLPFKAGGHGIRPWAAHGDAAFIGQWALSTQTAWSGELGRSYFPVLTDVIERAALPAPANAGEDRLADDLRGAWARSLATLDLLPRTSTAEQSRLVEVSGWAEATDRDIRRLIDMPDKAQRCLSKTVLAHQVEQFRDRVQDPTVGGGQRRYKNWLAESNDVAAAGWQAGAWNEDLQIPNGWHDVSLGPRRYRAPRPAVARANIDCPCKYAQGVAGLDCDGDHDEGSCSKHGGNRNAACDAVAEMLAALLLTAGFRDVRYRQNDSVLRNWDRSGGVRPPTSRRTPDIICTSPTRNVTYVIDVRIAWNITTGGGGVYDTVGDLAREAEVEKWRNWQYCCDHHPHIRDGTAVFMPFGVEISGALGPAATRLWEEAMTAAGAIRDTSLVHWSAPSFRRFWLQRLGTTLIRERGRVGSAAAKGEWPNLIRRRGHTDTEPCGMSV